ncbi:VOC family protein [Pontibacterium sp.]|uniref:VOC family protein n=1 Tax=Pontibacterium sp. TaxID=2036026 RepID=UPI0035142289
MPQVPFEFVALDHVVLRVQDMDRALHFYSEILGCTEERRVPSIGLVQLRAGSALIDLLPSDSPDHRSQNMDHFCLRIRPFDPARIKKFLQAYAVGDVEQRYGAQGMGRSLYISDPDGNVVELKEELQE